MFRRTAGTLLALSIATLPDLDVRAEEPAAFYDAPAIIGTAQVESLHALAAGRLTRLRHLRPGGADLPMLDRGGPSQRNLTGESLSDVIARAQDIPIFTADYRDFGLWSHGFGRKAGIGSSQGARGFSSTLAGGSTGIDLAVGENWVVGGVAGASTGTMAWNDDDAAGVTSGTATAIYAGYTDRDVFLDLSLSVGLTHVESHLSPDIGFDRTDATIGGRADAGLDLDWAGFSIRPVASASLVLVEVVDGGQPSSASEASTALTGPGSDGERMRQLRTFLGVRVARDFTIGDQILEASGGATWQNRVTFDAAPPAAKSDGRIAPIRKIEIDRDSIDPQLGLSLRLGEDWVAFTRYNGHFAGDRERHTVTGGLQARF